MSPIHRVIHYWLHDPEFSSSIGEPRELPVYGPISLESLIKKYAGDLPVGAVRKELEMRGAMIVDNDQSCTLQVRFLRFPDDSEDLIQNILFSLRNLLETVEFNSKDTELSSHSEKDSLVKRRFERIVWTNRLDENGIAAFEEWLETNGQQFLEEANMFLNNQESAGSASSIDEPVIGVGLYFYRQEQDDDGTKGYKIKR